MGGNNWQRLVKKGLATWHYDGLDTSKGAEIIDVFSVLVTTIKQGGELIETFESWSD